MPDKVHGKFWTEAQQRGIRSVWAMDFEGSGRTGVVEYGVVEIGPSGILRTWTDYCAPQQDISAVESHTHGLRNKDVKGKPAFSEFWDFFRDLRRSGPFLAHAAGVEERFLASQWSSPGQVEDWLRPEARIGWEWGPWLDSLEMQRKLLPKAESYSLSSLIEHTGLAPELDSLAIQHCPLRRQKWHSALYDALASALLFQRAVQRAPAWGLWRFRLESFSGEAKRSSDQQGEFW